MKIEGRNLFKSRPKYTRQEANIQGRMRIILKKADPEFPDTRIVDKPTDVDSKILRNRINKTLNKRGIRCKMLIKDENTAFDMWNCSLTPQYIDIYGINYDPITERESNRLGFVDVYDLARTLNDVMDEQDILGHVDLFYDKIDTPINIRHDEVRSQDNLLDFEFKFIANTKYGSPIFLADVLKSKGKGRLEFLKTPESVFVAKECDGDVLVEEDEGCVDEQRIKNMEMVKRIRGGKGQEITPYTDETSIQNIRKFLKKERTGEA